MRHRPFPALEPPPGRGGGADAGGGRDGEAQAGRAPPKGKAEGDRQAEGREAGPEAEARQEGGQAGEEGQEGREKLGQGAAEETGQAEETGEAEEEGSEEKALTMPETPKSEAASSRAGLEPPRFRDLFIGGAFVPAESGKTFTTTNPATGLPLAQIAQGDANDVDRAVAAARQAFEGGPWQKMTARERGRLLVRIAERLLARADEIAALETLDNGK